MQQKCNKLVRKMKEKNVKNLQQKRNKNEIKKKSFKSLLLLNFCFTFAKRLAFQLDFKKLAMAN